MNTLERQAFRFSPAVVRVIVALTLLFVAAVIASYVLRPVQPSVWDDWAIPIEPAHTLPL